MQKNPEKHRKNSSAKKFKEKQGNGNQFRRDKSKVGKLSCPFLEKI
jgi:hypothetical protein